MSPHNTHHRRLALKWRLFLGLIAAFVLVFLYAWLVEPRWIEVKKFRLRFPHLPGTWKGTRVVFLTDIHHGPFFDNKRLIAVVDQVNRLRPDLVLLGGDYVHRSPRFIEPCFRALARLQARHGVFGVLGNHDHWESATRTRLAMQAAGIRILDNQGYWLAKKTQRIRICGVGDMWEDKQRLQAALGGAGKMDFVVLVSHNPDYALRLPWGAVDLVLAGHTHGGQVTLFGLWAPILPIRGGQRFRSGLVWEKDIRMIVSNGIGTITPPLRFCARPQIVVVELTTP